MAWTILGPHAPKLVEAPELGGLKTQPPKKARPLDLSVAVSLEFFAAQNKSKFDGQGYETLRHLIRDHMNRANKPGPSGKVAQVYAPSEQELDSPKNGKVEYPAGSWVVTRNTTITPDHPEWFDHCKPLFVSPTPSTTLS